MGRVTSFYVSALRLVLARPLVLALGCVVLVGASYACYTQLGSDLLPEMDEGGFILDYLMPAGSSLADTNDVLLGVEEILKKTPKSKVLRAAPVYNSDSPPSPKPITAISR